MTDEELKPTWSKKSVEGVTTSIIVPQEVHDKLKMVCLLKRRSMVKFFLEDMQLEKRLDKELQKFAPLDDQKFAGKLL